MLEILNKTKNKLPLGRLFLKEVKDGVLGKKYNLSLVFVGNKISSKLNLKHRNKKGPTNVLSFSLEDNEGEIFIDLEKVKKESKEFETSYRKFFITLFIHSLLHLKGFDHGPKMERQEEFFKKKYLI